MELLLSTYRMIERGGSESYLLTVAEQLQRLGHDVTVHSIDDAEHSAQALERGLRYAAADRGLPERVDAILVQDAIVSYRLAERYPATPQLFVAHSSVFDLQLPPQLPGVVSTIVVMNEHVRWRVEALAVVPKVARLRQPIDTKVFAAGPALPARPRRLLAFGNAMPEERIAAIRATCEGAGIEFQRAGISSSPTADPQMSIGAADIVVGYGRCVLEAMSCGRAAFVYDRAGGDGWVTAESYPALEADGFSGRSDLAPPGRAELALEQYTPEMGLANRDLIHRHHRANVHAEELVALLREAAPPAVVERGALIEMARLVRAQWHSERHALALHAQILGIRRAEAEAEAERAAAQEHPPAPQTPRRARFRRGS